MSGWLNLLNAVVSTEAWTCFCCNFYRQRIVHEIPFPNALVHYQMTVVDLPICREVVTVLLWYCLLRTQKVSYLILECMLF